MGDIENSQISLKGGCHCKAVRFSVRAPKILICWKCNCSICIIKQKLHFIVPSYRFILEEGAGSLSLYTFNTHRAKHYFCKTCGICSFYIPRSNPDGVAVTVNCLDKTASLTGIEITVKEFDGLNWENSIADSNIWKQSKL